MWEELLPHIIDCAPSDHHHHHPIIKYFRFRRLITSSQVDIRFYGGIAIGYDDADHDDNKDDENANKQV